MEKNSLKNNPKIFFFLIPFVAGVALLAKIQEVSPLEFAAHGRITEINWEGPNHLQPFIEIKRYDNNRYVKLETFELSLSSEQVKVGDSFKKDAGSKVCEINDEWLQCIK